mmetsp:Transcript_7447/g.14194  ORF Transcript_7447/g.14194 Transcript_7447/m.14194 type:complete len:225 (+) Transcript_7447:2162-2836(+)
MNADIPRVTSARSVPPGQHRCSISWMTLTLNPQNWLLHEQAPTTEPGGHRPVQIRGGNNCKCCSDLQGTNPHVSHSASAGDAIIFFIKKNSCTSCDRGRSKELKVRTSYTVMNEDWAFCRISVFALRYWFGVMWFFSHSEYSSLDSLSTPGLPVRSRGMPHSIIGGGSALGSGLFPFLTSCMASHSDFEPNSRLNATIQASKSESVSVMTSSVLPFLNSKEKDR